MIVFTSRGLVIVDYVVALYCRSATLRLIIGLPDYKVHGVNVGPTWVLSAPGGPPVDPINLAIRAVGFNMLCLTPLYHLVLTLSRIYPLDWSDISPSSLCRCAVNCDGTICVVMYLLFGSIQRAYVKLLQFPTCWPMNVLSIYWTRGGGVLSFSESLVLSCAFHIRVSSWWHTYKQWLFNEKCKGKLTWFVSLSSPLLWLMESIQPLKGIY